MKNRVKCWELFECNEKECPAYKLKELKCWLVSGTHCRREIQGKFLEKIEMCLECEPFKANMDVDSMEETLKVVDRQFKKFAEIVEERDKELEGISMELALGLSEVFAALKEISSGDPSVSIPEVSKLELVRKLKHMVNATAADLGEIVGLSHEFAIGLAEHFDVLDRVSKGDLSARVSGASQVELLGSLRKVTNQMIESVSKQITERKQAEAELAQARKLEAVGQLAAGIAHEINTPTQFVGDNITFLKDALEDMFKLQEKQGLLLEAAKTGAVSYEAIEAAEAAAKEADVEYLIEEIPKAIEQSLDGVDRISKIVRAMKEFSHPGATGITECNINAAIETTITVARNEWKYVAEMKTELDPSLPRVPCLVSEFNQVILNLIINAAQAIGDVVGDGKDGLGTITVGTAHHDNWAEIRVSDTGKGIPKEIRDRIFEPFFTTKQVGKGSGQGLAMAHNVIMNKHHGQLTFETEEGKGTTFIVKLPLHSESME